MQEPNIETMKWAYMELIAGDHAAEVLRESEYDVVREVGRAAVAFLAHGRQEPRVDDAGLRVIETVSLCFDADLWAGVVAVADSVEPVFRDVGLG